MTFQVLGTVRLAFEKTKEFSKSHDTIAPQMIISDFTSKTSQLSPGL